MRVPDAAVTAVIYMARTVRIQRALANSPEDLGRACLAFSEAEVLGLEATEFEAEWPDGRKSDPSIEAVDSSPSDLARRWHRSIV